MITLCTQALKESIYFLKISFLKKDKNALLQGSTAVLTQTVVAIIMMIQLKIKTQ